MTRALVLAAGREQIQKHTRVEIAAARAHHHATQRRETHARVDALPCANGTQTCAVAQVRDDRALAEFRAEKRDHVFVRQAVKTVAPHALVPKRAWQGEALRDLGQLAMKRGVETRDLRQVRIVRAGSFECCQRRR
jgi:hypothetical protein